MVATVGGCPFNGAKCSVRWAMFAAFLSVACAMPLSHMNNDDYINTISRTSTMPHALKISWGRLSSSGGAPGGANSSCSARVGAL